MFPEGGGGEKEEAVVPFRFRQAKKGRPPSSLLPSGGCGLGSEIKDELLLVGQGEWLLLMLLCI